MSHLILIILFVTVYFGQSFVLPGISSWKNSPKQIRKTSFRHTESVLDAVPVETTLTTNGTVLIPPSGEDIIQLMSSLQAVHKSIDVEIEAFFKKFAISNVDDATLGKILKRIGQVPSLKCDKNQRMRHTLMVLFDTLIYRPEMSPSNFSELLMDFAECTFRIPSKYPLHKICYTLRRMLPDVPDVEVCLLQLSKLGYARRSIPEDILDIIGDKIAEMTNYCPPSRASTLLLALKDLGISMEDFDDVTYSHLVALYGKSTSS